MGPFVELAQDICHNYIAIEIYKEKFSQRNFYIRRDLIGRGFTLTINATSADILVLPMLGVTSLIIITL